ncbi:MAG: phosphate ABC transporter ATP-binding protein, partial [Ilumatobacteraceae bacterium]
MTETSRQTATPTFHEEQTTMTDAASPDGSLTTPNESSVFRTRDLSVYYGDFRAVRDVSLDIRQREITAFIGPS